MQGYGHTYYGHTQPGMPQGGYGRSGMSGSHPVMMQQSMQQVSYHIPVPKQHSGFHASYGHTYSHGGYSHVDMMQEYQRGYPPNTHHHGAAYPPHFARTSSFQHAPPSPHAYGRHGGGAAPFGRTQTMPNMYGGHAHQQGHFHRAHSAGHYASHGGGFYGGNAWVGATHPGSYQQGGQRQHHGYQQQQRHQQHSYGQGYGGFAPSGMRGVVVVQSNQGFRGTTTNWYIQDPYQQSHLQRSFSAQQMNMSDALFERAVHGMSTHLPLSQHGTTTHMVYPRGLLRGHSAPSLTHSRSTELLSVSHGIMSLRTPSRGGGGARAPGRLLGRLGSAGQLPRLRSCMGSTDLVASGLGGGRSAPNLDLHPALLRSASMPTPPVDSLAAGGGVGGSGGPKFNFIVVRSFTGSEGSRALGAGQQALPWGPGGAAELLPGAAPPQITHMSEGDYTAESLQGRIAKMLGGGGRGMSVQRGAGGRSVCVYNRLDTERASEIQTLVARRRAAESSALAQAIQKSCSSSSRALVPAVSQELVAGVQDLIARGATAGELLAHGVTSQELLAAGVDSDAVAGAEGGGGFMDLSDQPFGMPCNTFAPELPTTVMWVDYSYPEGEGGGGGEGDFARMQAQTRVMLYGTDQHDLDGIAQELLKGLTPELANGDLEIDDGAPNGTSPDSPDAREQARLGAPNARGLLGAPPAKLRLTHAEAECEECITPCATPRTPRDVCGTPRGYNADAEAKPRRVQAKRAARAQRASRAAARQSELMLSTSAEGVVRVAVAALFMALVAFLALLTAFLFDVDPAATLPGLKAPAPVRVAGNSTVNATLYMPLNVSVNNATVTAGNATLNVGNATLNVTLIGADEVCLAPFQISVDQFRADRYDAPLFDVTVSYNVSAPGPARKAPFFRRPHGPTPLQPECYAKPIEELAPTPAHAPPARLRREDFFAALGRVLPFGVVVRPRPAPMATPPRRKNPIARSFMLFV